MNLNVLGVTLARGGSKGVPGKNRRLLAGKPLINYTIEVAHQCDFANYVVSSDDGDILRIAAEAGCETITRPAELARDDTPTLPALQHALQWAEKRHGRAYHYIVELRATSPFKTADDVQRALRLLVDSGADSVIAVTECQEHHPARVKYLNEWGYIRDFYPEPESGRRQDLIPTVYVRAGGIYALKREALTGENGKVLGHEKSLPLILPPERAVNIDSELDFAFAEFLMERIPR